MNSANDTIFFTLVQLDPRSFPWPEDLRKHAETFTGMYAEVRTPYHNKSFPGIFFFHCLLSQGSTISATGQ